MQIKFSSRKNQMSIAVITDTINKYNYWTDDTSGATDAINAEL